MKIIDIHIHGGYGVNFNTSSKDEIKLLLKKLHKRGIVAICPTLVGDKSEKIYERLKLLKELKSECGSNECYIIGAHLEGTFLSPKKPGVQNPEVFLKPSVQNFINLVRDTKDIVKIVTIAPEEDEDDELARYLESCNIKAHAGHTLASNIGATSATTHHFNAMPKLSHRGENLTLDTLFDNKVYCEIIADGTHVSNNMLKMFFAIKDKSKIILVSDALPSAHSENNIMFCSKKITPCGRDENGVLAGSVKFLDEITDYVTAENLITKSMARDFVYKNVLEHLTLDENERKIIENLA